MGRHSWSMPGRNPLPLLWAQAGLMTIAVDAYGFGSREGPDNRGRLGPHRGDLIFRTRDARMQAVQDLMRTVDYLQSREDVRGDAIGYAGVSMGCRVLLHHLAHDAATGTEDEERAANFKYAESISYLNDKGYLPPDSDDWVEEVRSQGNEANHDLAIKTGAEAELLMSFTAALLVYIYELKGQYATSKQHVPVAEPEPEEASNGSPHALPGSGDGGPRNES